MFGLYSFNTIFQPMKKHFVFFLFGSLMLLVVSCRESAPPDETGFVPDSSNFHESAIGVIPHHISFPAIVESHAIWPGNRFATNHERFASTEYRAREGSFQNPGFAAYIIARDATLPQKRETVSRSPISPHISSIGKGAKESPPGSRPV
jgi:hypothetical protein